MADVLGERRNKKVINPRLTSPISKKFSSVSPDGNRENSRYIAHSILLALDIKKDENPAVALKALNAEVATIWFATPFIIGCRCWSRYQVVGRADIPNKRDFVMFRLILVL